MTSRRTGAEQSRWRAAQAGAPAWSPARSLGLVMSRAETVRFLTRRGKCGSPPQVSSTSGAPLLGRRTRGTCLIHRSTRPPPACCPDIGQSTTTAAAPTCLESVAPFDRPDGVRRSRARRTREDRLHAGDDDLARPSPDDRVQQGIVVRDRLPALAVYLGHVSPQNTYWYLTATPPVLEPAAARFEAFVDGKRAP